LEVCGLRPGREVPRLSHPDEQVATDDWHIHAIVDTQTVLAAGLASSMRVEPEAGSIEVGAIMYSPHLQRTTAGTAAMYLMMKRAFDELGYRRYERRCNALNEGSMSAAMWYQPRHLGR
jgi:RimJ/RimL family protein N-acetyltransferase